ncbi:MAG TPA: acyl-CoA dehydrogenase family protein [Terriglobales bacterium]|nr:acyl-CoA dehydrogenase family protein [Terriglobales bacterium]
MEFAWTAEQHHSCEQARLFALRELGAGSSEPASQSQFLEAWRKCSQFGLQALNIPAAFGGLGLDVRSAVHVLEGLGAGCRDNGLLMALGAQLWSVAVPLLQFGSEEQKRLWLPALAQGKSIGAFALTEPESGSDVFHLRTRAVAEAGGFRIEGTKCFVTNAPVADLFLVIAATDSNAGYFGLTALLLRRELVGLEVGPPLRKMGLESSPMSEIRFEGLWVPRESVLGEVGGGGAVVMNTLEWERGCLLAPALGTMERLLQETTQFLKLRKQFGRPVIEFEAVGERLAELRLRLEVSRLLAYQFAWMKDEGLPAALHASMTKLYVSESLRRASELAVHLHGAAGYMRELEFERTWRDAMASSLYSGTTEMQHNLIAESLLRPTPHRPAARSGEAGR